MTHENTLQCHMNNVNNKIDRWGLGSRPHSGPDAPRPYEQALCAPYHFKVAQQLY
jgi:hypothetical protein